MRTRTTPARTTQLRRVCRQFEHWRRTRPRRSAIPASLWALAVAHARAVGVHATARRLRLDYYALKQRVDAVAAGAPRASAGPAFVEVVPTGGGPAGVTECVIDLADDAFGNPDRKSTRLNSSHSRASRMPSSA